MCGARTQSLIGSERRRSDFNSIKHKDINYICQDFCVVMRSPQSVVGTRRINVLLWLYYYIMILAHNLYRLRNHRRTLVGIGNVAALTTMHAQINYNRRCTWRVRTRTERITPKTDEKRKKYRKKGQRSQWCS